LVPWKNLRQPVKTAGSVFQELEQCSGGFGLGFSLLSGLPRLRACRRLRFQRGSDFFGGKTLRHVRKVVERPPVAEADVFESLGRAGDVAVGRRDEAGAVGRLVEASQRVWRIGLDVPDLQQTSGEG
jgi:hypothetical protein